jgi:E3 ubiquitin-protein ligase synoviolin
VEEGHCLRRGEKLARVGTLIETLSTRISAHAAPGRAPGRLAAHSAKMAGVSMGVYVFVSTLLLVSMLGHAWTTRRQFYPAMVYLSHAKLSAFVFTNYCFMLVLLCGRVLQKVFVGSLTLSEESNILNNAKFALFDTCLALTIFREELNWRTLTMLTVLLFIKVFHWLAEARVEHVARAEEMPALYHVRLVALVAILLAIDFIAAVKLVKLSLVRPSVLFLFAFEFTVLLVDVIALAAKYALLRVDAVMEGRAGTHSTLQFYLEFCADLMRIFLYLTFFMLIYTWFGLPIHLVREFYVTILNLRERLVRFLHFRQISRTMKLRFPTVAPDDPNDPCIICREPMQLAKALPCGHLFHFHCLQTWFQRSQSCPTCRTDVPNRPSAEELAALRDYIAAQRERREAEGLEAPREVVQWEAEAEEYIASQGSRHRHHRHHHHRHQHRHHHHHHRHRQHEQHQQPRAEEQQAPPQARDGTPEQQAQDPLPRGSPASDVTTPGPATVIGATSASPMPPLKLDPAALAVPAPLLAVDAGSDAMLSLLQERAMYLMAHIDTLRRDLARASEAWEENVQLQEAVMRSVTRTSERAWSGAEGKAGHDAEGESKESDPPRQASADAASPLSRQSSADGAARSAGGLSRQSSAGLEEVRQRRIAKLASPQ